MGRISTFHQAICVGTLMTFRVGKRHVIPLAEFERWISGLLEMAAGRPLPPMSVHSDVTKNGCGGLHPTIPPVLFDVAA